MTKAQHKNFPLDYKRASSLRRESSLVERLLWQELRGIPDAKFRRQHPIHPYIADFACLKFRLIIELDGASHDARQAYDERRDIYLNRLGYRILRFSNNHVMEDVESVVMTILQEIKALKTKSPSPCGRG